MADAVWSSGKLKIISYADQPVSGNGVTYSPNLTPVLVVDDGMMVPDPGQPPLKTTRKDPMDLYNQVTVEYWDRANDYNTATAVSEDAAHVDSYGPRPAPSVTAHFIASAAMAQHVADLAREVQVAQEAGHNRVTMSFRAGEARHFSAAIPDSMRMRSGIAFCRWELRLGRAFRRLVSI